MINKKQQKKFYFFVFVQKTKINKKNFDLKNKR